MPEDRVLRTRDDILLAVEGELRDVVSVVSRAAIGVVHEIPQEEIRHKKITRVSVQKIIQDVFNNLAWLDAEEDDD